MPHLKRAVLDRGRFPLRDHYPYNLDIFREDIELTFTSPVTIFAGENGTGKSTVLRALAHAAGIHIWGEITRERYERNPYEDELYRAVTVEWADGPVPGSFFASQTFRNFTSLLDEWAASDPAMLDYYGGRSLMTQSHGQSLMAYFRNRYRRPGIYFLDEPETALSPNTQIELLDVIGECAVSGLAQFVVATHSPLLLSCKDAVIYSFDGGMVVPVKYTDTDHYKVYRDFFRDMDEAAR